MRRNYMHVVSGPMTDAQLGHATVYMPIGSRCMRIVRMSNHWRVWTATDNYQHGTYLMLCNDGMVVRVTARVDEGDEIMLVRPTDADA